MMDLLISDVDLDGTADIKIRNGPPGSTPAFRSVRRNDVVAAGDAVADLDGDGLPDYLKANTHWIEFFTPGTMTMFWDRNRMTVVNAPLPFSEMLPQITVSTAGFPDLYNEQYPVTFGGTFAMPFPPIVDINGDGAQDIVVVGAGVAGPAIGSRALTGLPTAGFITSNGQMPQIFADLNGDGLPDSIGFMDTRAGMGGVVVFINKGLRAGGGGFVRGSAGSDLSGLMWTTAWLRGINFAECEQFYPYSVSCNEMPELEGSGEPAAVVPTDAGLRVADFNGDGRQDILSFGVSFESTPPNPDQRGIHMSDSRYLRQPVQLILGGGGGGSVRTTDAAYVIAGFPGVNGSTTPNTEGIAPHAFDRLLDVNGDGLTDFTSVQERTAFNGVTQIHLYIHDGKKPDLLRSVTNGFGATDSVEYDHLGNRDSTTYAATPPGTCKYPQYCVNKALWVVAKVHRDTGGALDGTPTADFTYQYRDARSDVQGLGWIGFSGTTVTNDLTGEVVDTTYGNAFSRFTTTAGVSSYPQARVATNVTRTWKLDPAHFLRRTGTYGYTVGSSGEVLLASSVEEDQESQGQDFLTKTRTTVLLQQYDAYGNAQHESELVEQRDDRALDMHGVLMTTTDATFDNDPANWLLGLKRTRRTELQTFGEGAEDIVRNEAWDYFAGTRLVAHAIREPNGPEHLRLATTFERNARGLPTRITRTDALGATRAIDIGYDAVVGHLAETVTTGGMTATVRQHPTLDVVTRTSDPNGAGGSYVYDTFGRQKRVLPDLAGATTLTYVPAIVGTGALSVYDVTDGEPERVTVFDRLGRTRMALVQRLETSAFAATFTDYDAVGRVARVSTPLEPTASAPSDYWLYTNYEYDGAGRLTQTTYPAEGVDVTVPSGVPNPTPIITPKPMGQVRRAYDWLSAYEYQLDRFSDVTPQIIRATTTDALDNVTSTSYTDPATARSVTTTFRYGAAGSVTGMLDAVGNQTSMIYDAWGRRTTLVDPDLGTTVTVYNAFDEAVSDTTPRGTTIHGLDDLGRWTGDSGPDGVSTLEWDLQPNGLARPSHASSPDQIQTSWSYDSAARPRATTWAIPGEPTPVTLERTRDEFGRLASIVYPPSGAYTLTAVYGYSPTGYLATVSRQEASGAVPIWTVDERAIDGQIARETFGDGSDAAQTQSFRTYSFTGRLVGQVTNSLPASERLHSASYDYDGLGRIKNSSGDTFQYDFLDHLQVWNHASSAWTETYDYDDIGNLRHHSGSDRTGARLDETYTFGDGAGPHALTGGPDGSYGYDEIGNQKSAPDRTVTFWEFGLPEQITKAGVQTVFKYDASHNRVVKSNDQGSTTVSIGGLYEKRLDNGQTTYANYVLGERGVVAQISIDALGNRHMQQLHDDHLGSLVLVTDENGVPSTIDFDPWGRRVSYDASGVPIGSNMSVAGVRIGFTGHDEDGDLGLVNMHGRIYDPQQRRFISPDPFIPELLNGQSHNRYSYVLNNPLNLIDPTGFDGETISGTQVSGPPAPAGEEAPSVTVYGQQATPSAPAAPAQASTTSSVHDVPSSPPPSPSDSVGIYVGGGNSSVSQIPSPWSSSISSQSGAGSSGSSYFPRSTAARHARGRQLRTTDLGTIVVPSAFPTPATEESDSLVRILASTAVGFIPYVGIAQSVLELITGWDYIAGIPATRELSAIAVMAAVIPGGKGLLKALSESDAVTRAAKSGYRIIDGVHRSRAAVQLGKETIRAEIYAGDKLVATGDVAVESLRSLKPAIPLSGKGLYRWMRALEEMANGTSGPIKVTALPGGTPIKNVRLIRPRE